jgi:phage shock protein PspC (stress-responsive transcriptional regulator)
MKKALTITIAGTLFTIEEDAYDVLRKYIQSVEVYFSSYEDAADITKEIEARIAEQLLEKKVAVITIDDIQALISKMGKVEDFGDETVHTKTAEEKTEPRRRLYRNPDDVVIAGVASGLAAYFDIDPLIMRIIFVALALMTTIGPGILIYIILALVIPLAKTPAEKVQMHGGPIDLKSFRDNFARQAKEVKNRGSELFASEKPRRFLEKVFSTFGKIVRALIKIVFAVVGSVGTLIATLAFIFLTIAFINLVFNVHTPYVQFPLAQVISGPLYYGLVILGYTLVLIPLVFIWSLFISIARRKKLFNFHVGIGLMSIWIIALIVAATVGVRYAPEIHDRILALPQYQTVVKDEQLKDFTKLELHGIDRVQLVQAPEFKVTVEGRQIDLDRVGFEVKDGTLIMKQESLKRFCYFCLGRNQASVTIAMPTIESISTHGMVQLSADEITQATIALHAEDLSRITLGLSSRQPKVEVKDAARITLKGASPIVSIETKDLSKFDGSEFLVRNASAKSSDNSSILVAASETLTAEAKDISRISYIGTPKVSQKVSDFAKIEAKIGTTTSEVNQGEF